MMKDLDKKVTEVKTQSLAEGGTFIFGDIPIRKFFDQSQYIENSILPAIERRSGKDSSDYKFFSAVVNSLLYGTVLLDRQNRLVLRAQQLGQINDILQARLDLAERELLKYTTMEDLVLTESLDKIAANVIRRIQEKKK